MLVGFTGRKRTGKTRLAIELADDDTDRYIVLVNTTNADYPLKGARFAKSFDQVDFNKSPRWDVIEPDPETLPDFLDYLLENAPDFDRRVLIIIDELADYQSSQSADWSLLALHRKGENRGVDSYWTTQRPAEVHSTIWTQTDEVYAFFLDDKDFEYVRKNCGLTKFYAEPGETEDARAARIEAYRKSRAIREHLGKDCPLPDCPVKTEIGVSQHGHNYIRWDKGPVYFLGDPIQRTEIELSELMHGGPGTGDDGENQEEGKDASQAEAGRPDEGGGGKGDTVQAVRPPVDGPGKESNGDAGRDSGDKE